MNTLVSALQQALKLHSEPGLLFAMQRQTLPADMTRVLRIVSDETYAQDYAKDLNLGVVELQQLSASYLRNVCLHAGSEPLRCLGLNDAQDLRLAKEHHRLLMKWLHPDRNADQQVFAERVNQAWTQLKSGRFSARQQVAKTWQVSEPQVVTTSHSRFPLFLWLLFATGLVLLTLSMLWPDQEIYGTDVPSPRSTYAQKVAAEETQPVRLDLPEMNWNSEPTTTAKSKPLPEAKPFAATPAPVSLPVLVKKGPSRTASAEHATPEATPNRLKPFAAESIMLAKTPETLPATTGVTINDKVVASYDAVQSDAASIAASGASKAEAMQVLQAFSRHYQYGQLDPFMSLFSADARNDRGDRSLIAQDYGRLFNGSRKRSLDFSRLDWQPQSFGWRLTALYLAKVQRDSDMLPAKNKGTIELDFVDEGGRVKIRRIALR